MLDLGSKYRSNTRRLPFISKLVAHAGSKDTWCLLIRLPAAPLQAGTLCGNSAFGKYLLASDSIKGRDFSKGCEAEGVLEGSGGEGSHGNLMRGAMFPPIPGVAFNAVWRTFLLPEMSRTASSCVDGRSRFVKENKCRDVHRMHHLEPKHKTTPDLTVLSECPLGSLGANINTITTVNWPFDRPIELARGALPQICGLSWVGFTGAAAVWSSSKCPGALVQHWPDAGARPRSELRGAKTALARQGCLKFLTPPGLAHDRDWLLLLQKLFVCFHQSHSPVFEKRQPHLEATAWRNLSADQALAAPKTAGPSPSSGQGSSPFPCPPNELLAWLVFGCLVGSCDDQ